jgi:hypothetical protein
LAGHDDVNDQRDIVLRTELATAFVAPRWWPNNHGHVLVIPNAHHRSRPLPGFASQAEREPYARRLRDYFTAPG